MLEFLRSKVRLPNAVWQALEDRRLALFCGTGISVYTGLPDARALTLDLFRACGVPLSVWPRRRTELLETLAAEPSQPWDLAFWDGRFDRALALLERQVPRGEMRRKLLDLLSPPPPDHAANCALHRDLLDLAALPSGGHRLVTTAFDDRFSRAAGGGLTGISEAPRIAVPHPEHWRSLTYLHGRICESADRSADDLIVTSADFGRAYLQDGWATRFAVGLFREFTVLFVGYDVKDPVLSYLVDAIALDRESGRPLHQPYALAGLDEGADRHTATSQWRSKGLEPILYSTADGHRELHETIAEWAALHRGGFECRLAKACSIMGRTPVSVGAEGPDEIETLVWALSAPDGSVARAIADGQGYPDSAQPPRIAWLGALLDWGERMTERRRERGAAIDPHSDADGDRESLGAFPVDGYWLGDPLAPPAEPDRLGTHIRHTPLFHREKRQPLHPVAWHLARWILAHLHEPELARLVAQRRGRIGRALRDALVLELEGRDTPLPGDLDRFWRIVVRAHDRQIADPGGSAGDRWMVARLASGTLESDTRERLLAALGPRIAIGPARTLPELLAPGAKACASDEAPDRLCALADIRLKDYGDRRSVLEVLDWLRAPRQATVFADLAGDLGECLVRVLRCAQWIEYSDPLRMHEVRLPSLHETRGDDLGREDWASLVELCRDALRALTDQDRDSGELLLRRWCRYGREPWGALFVRLALHACTRETYPPELALGLLLDNPHDALWDSVFVGELRPFLAALGARVHPRHIRALECALREGPPTGHWSRQPDGQRPHWELLADERSAWLAPGDATARSEGAAHDPRQSDTWRAQGTGRTAVPAVPGTPFHRVYSADPQPPIALSPEQAAAVLAGLPEQDAGKWIEAYARLKPVRALKAFAILSQRQSECAAHLLQWLICGIADARRPRRFLVTGPSLAPWLDLAERHQGRYGLWGYCAWLQAAATALAPEQEHASAFWSIWDRVWSAALDLPEDPIPDDADTVALALNAPGGRLSLALLKRLWKRGAQEDSGLPADLCGRFDGLVAGDAHTQRYARAILASRLVWLHRIAPDWCERHLIARLSDVESAHSEAPALWRAFLQPAKVSAKLWPPMKPALLQALGASERLLPQDRERLALLFAFQWLRPGSFDEETDAQGLLDLLDGLDAKVLEAIAGGFADALRAAGESAARLWRDQIASKILDYWPLRPVDESAAVNERLGAMLIRTRESFPDAVRLLTVDKPVLGGVKTLLPILDPLTRQEAAQDQAPGTFDYIVRFPGELLTLLDVLAVPGTTEHRHDGLLIEVLARIQGPWPEASETAAMERLRAFVRQGANPSRS